jgi:hypothetical protein
MVAPAYTPWRTGRVGVTDDVGHETTKLPKVSMRTNLGFVFAMLERSITDSLSLRKFGKEEMVEVLAFFDTNPPECVFCGTTAVSPMGSSRSGFYGRRDGARRLGHQQLRFVRDSPIVLCDLMAP